MPQDITRAFRATSLSTLILHYPLVSAMQADSCELNSESSPPRLSTSSSDSASVQGELTQLSLSLSSPWKNLPEDWASESATELDTPTSIHSYYEFKVEFNSNIYSNSNSNSNSNSSYSPTSLASTSSSSFSSPFVSSSASTTISQLSLSSAIATSSSQSSVATSSTSSSTAPSDAPSDASSSSFSTVSFAPVSTASSMATCSASSGVSSAASSAAPSAALSAASAAAFATASAAASSAQKNKTNEKGVRGQPWMLRPELRKDLVDIITPSAESRWEPLTEIAYMAGIQASGKALRHSLALDGYHQGVARKKSFLNYQHISVSLLYSH